MAVRVKSTAASAEKFVTNGAQATPAYQEGIAGVSADDYANAATAAAPAQQAGSTAAFARKAFEKGIAAKKDKWKRNSSGKGVTNFGPGIAAARPDYEQGVGPYLDVIRGLTLPPKGPKGIQGNYARVFAIGDALHKKKVGG